MTFNPRAHFWTLLAGAAVAGIYWFQKNKIDHAIATGESDDGAAPSSGSGASINVRLTTYYTGGYTSAAEAKLEGGANDSAGRPLITLDQHLADPSTYPYASLSGDNTVFPYGQRVSIDAWPSAVFRIVDTGGSFSSNFSKVYRLAGYEPIDVCSAKPQAATVGHPTTAVMTVYPGDDWASLKPSSVKSLDYSNVEGQSPSGQQLASSDDYGASEGGSDNLYGEDSAEGYG